VSAAVENGYDDVVAVSEGSSLTPLVGPSVIDIVNNRVKAIEDEVCPHARTHIRTHICSYENTLTVKLLIDQYVKAAKAMRTSAKWKFDEVVNATEEQESEVLKAFAGSSGRARKEARSWWAALLPKMEDDHDAMMALQTAIDQGGEAYNR
jgi:hypothetical protein